MVQHCTIHFTGKVISRQNQKDMDHDHEAPIKDNPKVLPVSKKLPDLVMIIVMVNYFVPCNKIGNIY